MRFDIKVEGSNEIIDIEMQVTDEQNLRPRSRVYEGHVSVLPAQKGDKKFEHVRGSYVIFICMFDPIGQGAVVYERKQIMLPVGPDNLEPSCWETGSGLWVLNAKFRHSSGSAELDELLNYMRTSDVHVLCGGELLPTVAGRITA